MLYDVLLSVLTSLSKFAYFSKYHKVRQILDWTWFFLTYRNFSFHPTFYEATLPPCQVINCYVHMYAPSSEYFKRVKQRARVIFFAAGKAQLHYLLTCLFIYLFVWLNLLWDEGKAPRDHDREQLTLHMSDHMMQSACMMDIAGVFLFACNFCTHTLFWLQFSPHILFIKQVVFFSSAPGKNHTK